MRRVFIFIFVFFAAVIASGQQQNKKQPLENHQSPGSKIDSKLEVQIWLDRKNFSPGEIDGTMGKNTQKALTAFQEAHKIPVTSNLGDPKTVELLREKGVDPIASYTITQADVKGPFTEKIPQDFMDQAKLPRLSYTSPLEALSEKFHVSPEILKRLNPNSNFAAGSEIRVPNVLQTGKASEEKKVQQASVKKQSSGNVTVVLSKDRQDLMVKDGDGKTIFFAPITAGSDQYPYPIGTWKVKGVAKNPPFNYSPELFKDAKPTHKKAKLPPGPNNPVGVVWIDLSAPHYGLHGTPVPEKIGYSESHGCIRLTNWDVQKLASLVTTGTPVIFE